MGRAIALARRGLGRVEPNPLVGCVIVRANRVVGEGFHRRFGGPHAEIIALANAGPRAAGAEVYVSLEPCAHHGKTPPCTEALIRANVARVVAAVRDPSSHAAGRGFRKLRAAGIRVEVGCMSAEASDLLTPFATLVERRRPHVILKWAQSLDGRLTPPRGEPRTVSGEAAHRFVHRLRARVDGIMVGIGTAASDDPMLTARDVPIRRTATRMVVDSQLRIRSSSALVRTASDVPTLVLTAQSALKTRQRQAATLRRAGVRIVGCRSRSGRVDLEDALRKLGAMKMTNVLVEGGPRLLSALLARRLADEAFVFVASRIIGGSTPPVQFDSALAGPTRILVRRVPPDTLYQVNLR